MSDQSVTRKPPSKPRARAASAIIAGAKAAGAAEVRFLDDGTIIVRLAEAPPTMPATEQTDDIKSLL